jgi:hypothetical protein
MKLRFHQATCDLTGWAATLDDAVPPRLDELEARSGRRLPASLREWLCLPAAAQRHHELDGRAALLRAFETARPQDTPFPLLMLGGDGGDGTCYLALDGSDDPPVLEESPNAYDDDLHLRCDRFSAFVFSAAWNEPWWGWWFEAEDVPFGPPQLDFLKENFHEGPTGHGEGGRWWRAFFADGARLSVWPWHRPSSPGTVHWLIRARTAELLEATTRRVWEVCGLFGRLFSRRPENMHLLAEMLRRRT